jgi:hypothetical protein
MLYCRHCCCIIAAVTAAALVALVAGKCQGGTCAGMNANINAAAQGETEPVIFKARFASTAGLNGATSVILYGRKGNATDGIGDVLGTLYDDGDRVHDDRYAGDGLYSNVIFIEFPKTNEPVYRNFYVGLLDKDVSSQGEFTGQDRVRWEVHGVPGCDFLCE